MSEFTATWKLRVIALAATSGALLCNGSFQPDKQPQARPVTVNGSHFPHGVNCDALRVVTIGRTSAGAERFLISASYRDLGGASIKSLTLIYSDGVDSKTFAPQPPNQTQYIDAIPAKNEIPALGTMQRIDGYLTDTRGNKDFCPPNILSLPTT